MSEGQKKTLGLAIASLVCGCLFFIPLLGVILSLTAIVLGVVALVIISKNKDSFKGNGMAIGGIVLGGIGIIIIPIIALIAAIAIPNFLRAKISAQEAAASAALRTIATAEISYQKVNSRYASLSELADAELPYIDSTLAGGIKDGYVFKVSSDDYSDNFYATAVPKEKTMARSYYIDEDGILCKASTAKVSLPDSHQDEGCPIGFKKARRY